MYRKIRQPTRISTWKSEEVISMNDIFIAKYGDGGRS